LASFASAEKVLRVCPARIVTATVADAVPPELLASVHPPFAASSLPLLRVSVMVVSAVDAALRTISNSLLGTELALCLKPGLVEGSGGPGTFESMASPSVTVIVPEGGSADWQHVPRSTPPASHVVPAQAAALLDTS
jgi:hypothetical protein